MSRSLTLAIATLTTLTGLVSAQSFVEPTFYVWGDHRPLSMGPVPYQNLVNMINVDAYGHSLQDQGTVESQSVDPGEAAHQAAREILARIYAESYWENGMYHDHSVSDLQPNQVCITFFGLGRDQADCDGNQASGPSRQLSRLRFFREEDRLPGMLDNDIVGTPAMEGFPVPVAGNGVDPSPNRAYRHPFLINAGDPGIGQPVATSPLRDWVYKFAEEYRRLQTQVYTGTNGTHRLPDPARVYLDTEAQITFAAGDRNQVFMLWWLAQPAQATIWNTRQVPGFPTGTTLASLYMQATAPTAWGLPTNINDSVAGLDPMFAASDWHNRPFMLWWEGVCLRAQSHVLKHSVYDVFHSFWPATEASGTYKLQCGNYEDFAVDSGSYPGNATWFLDYTSPYASTPNRGPRNQAKQTFPRAWMPSMYEGAEMSGVGNAFGGKRWLTKTPHLSGDVNSPTAYHVKDFGAGEALRLPSLYRPFWQLETRRESAVRLARHTAESIIESNNNVAKGPLVPWIQQAFTNLQGGPDAPASWRTVRPEDLEDTLLMLRAKNTPEYIFWTGYNPTSNNATLQAMAEYAWALSSDVAERVYTPRIVGYRPILGPLTSDTPATMESSRLEFTLKEAGVSRTVGQQSDRLGSGWSTGLMVVFSGFGDGCANPIKINVESAADGTAVHGSVMAWDNASEGWFVLQHMPEPADPTVPNSVPTLTNIYRYWTPVGVDGLRTARVSCYLNQSQAPTRRFVDDEGRLKLMIQHVSPSQFTSRVDLVQAILTPGCSTPGCPLPTCLPPIELPKADFDLDGEVTGADLEEFLSKWSEFAFHADIDLDGDVDADDLMKFLSDYTGT